MIAFVKKKSTQIHLKAWLRYAQKKSNIFLIIFFNALMFTCVFVLDHTFVGQDQRIENNWGMGGSTKECCYCCSIYHPLHFQNFIKFITKFQLIFFIIKKTIQENTLSLRSDDISDTQKQLLFSGCFFLTDLLRTTLVNIHVNRIPEATFISHWNAFSSTSSFKVTIESQKYIFVKLTI